MGERDWTKVKIGCRSRGEEQETRDIISNPVLGRKVAGAPFWKEITFHVTPGNFQGGINPPEKSHLVLHLCNEMYNGHFQAFKVLECAKLHSWSQVPNSYVPLSLGSRHTTLGFHRAAWLPHSSKQSCSKNSLAVLTTQE